MLNREKAMRYFVPKLLLKARHGDPISDRSCATDRQIRSLPNRSPKIFELRRRLAKAQILAS